MTKKDLKTGMTVKLRNGDVCLVINDCITDYTSFLLLTDLDDNLFGRDECAALDIVEVYQFTNPLYKSHSSTLKTLLDLTNSNMKLLWKRQDLPKLSSAERVVLDKLDKKYKLIARDSAGELYVFCEKPHKLNKIWVSPFSFLKLDFPTLFRFVKWEDEQPYSIENLLKGEK